MPSRPRATFTKRQKEQARQEKQRAKAERKAQRKIESQNPTEGDDLGENASELELAEENQDLETGPASPSIPTNEKELS